MSSANPPQAATSSMSATPTSTCGDPSHADLLVRLQTQTELVATLQKRIIQLEEPKLNAQKREWETKRAVATKRAEVLNKELNNIVARLPTPALRALFKLASVVEHCGEVCLRLKPNDEPATLFWVSTRCEGQYEHWPGQPRQRVGCTHKWRLCALDEEESEEKQDHSQMVDEEEKGDQPDAEGTKGDEVAENAEENGCDSGESEPYDEDEQFALFSLTRFAEEDDDDSTTWECDGLVDLLREWKAIPNENETELIRPPTDPSGTSPFHPLQPIEMPATAQHNDNDSDRPGCTPHTYAFGSTLILWLGNYVTCRGHGFDGIVKKEFERSRRVVNPKYR